MSKKKRICYHFYGGASDIREEEILKNLVVPKLSSPASLLRSSPFSRAGAKLFCFEKMSESNNNFQMKVLDQGMVEE